MEENEKGLFRINLKLPEDVTCDYCILQWHYTAGKYLLIFIIRTIFSGSKVKVKMYKIWGRNIEIERFKSLINVKETVPNIEVLIC